jgi:type I restriction-modification system DNA methylase subunit
MPASKKEAKEFVKRWKKRLGAIPAGSNNEQQDTQKFWVDLLINVLGIPSNTIDSFVDFERKVRGRRIDVFVSDHNFLCEQKSWGIDLDKPEPRNGGMETPLQQAMWYARHLSYSERPRWVMTCNFGTFRLYDLDNERPEDTVQEFSLEELPDSLYLLSFLTSNETSRLHKEQQLSIEAGAYVSRLYDALAKQYHHIEEKDERAQEEQRSLNVLITRIIFLLYAEDADLLQSHQAFGRYCEGDPAKLRRKLVDLFETIDTPLEQRDEYMDEDLAAFPYVNGGLFADSSIIVPQMTSEILEAITDASQDFDWREISGVIFGGVFEGTLNPETRHAGGMHYTSVENIERCLKPLFLDELWDELHEAEGERTAAKRKQALARLHDKVASITIGDPACGSGNFLTEAYRQLRTIENRIIEDELSEETGNAGQTSLVIAQDSPVRVSLDQLYGIEINDFAVSVAKTALWITEEQMLRKTQEIYVGYDFDFLLLRSLSNLHEGNALKTDWSEVFPDDLTYLVGNPPFLGARNQSKEQKAELLEVFDGAKNAGNIDYCGAWYMKAARFTQGKRTRCALVSTNSICQGEQVANLWKPLHDLGIHIDFAHNTFRWDNEAADKAHVFCVIVGFSRENCEKRLYVHDTPDAAEVKKAAKSINAYLSDAPDAFIWNRNKPICDVPKIGIGNKPIDGGFYLFADEEKTDFLNKEPGAESYFHRWIGSREFLHGESRWCLYLGDAAFAELKELPRCRERIEAVREYRLASKSAPTRKLADRPAHFHVENMPKGNSIVVPKVSSERRRYIPMGFVGPETLCSDLVFLIPNASLYHFGVLQSQFHNAWMRTVAGRLKSDYRYSGGIVYNNFVWPEPTVSQREEVERCA